MQLVTLPRVRLRRYRALNTLLSACAVAPVSAELEVEAPRVSTRIGRVMVWIDDRLDQPLSVERLADEVELSKYHFSRVFREEVGETPWAYVRKARLRRAKELLERGASPAEAAVDAGFFDQSHLTNTMRQVEGTTPKEYQQSIGCETDRNDFQE